MTLKFAYTYIMTNKGHSVLYTGCTNDLIRRVAEHKSHHYKGSFTDKYNCEYCVYFQEFTSYQSAIDEENRIKGLSRKAKIELIEKKESRMERTGYRQRICLRQNTLEREGKTSHGRLNERLMRFPAGMELTYK